MRLTSRAVGGAEHPRRPPDCVRWPYRINSAIRSRRCCIALRLRLCGTQASSNRLRRPRGGFPFRAARSCFIVVTRQIAFTSSLTACSASFPTELSTHGGLVARIGPGDVVGEMGCITGQPRNATVRALRNTELLSIAWDEMERLTGRIRRYCCRSARQPFSGSFWRSREDQARSGREPSRLLRAATGSICGRSAKSSREHSRRSDASCLSRVMHSRA